MRIAILGGGFAGLAVAWYVLHYSQGSATVDLYDPEPVGGGASGLSSGLLHPYTGKQARPVWEAENCMRETHRLITAASQAISKPLILSKGILRPALSEQQITDFKTCASAYPDTHWWDKKQCASKIEGLKLPPEGGGLYIPEGLTLDVKTYLQGLWQACALHSTQHHHEMRITQEEMASYDRVLISMGVLSRNFSALKDLPLTPVKGQLIGLKWPKNVPPLPLSLISQKYIVMSPDQKSCVVGATFEHHFTAPQPDPEFAKQQIMPHIISFFPALENAELLFVRAGFRGSSPNHLPMVGKIASGYYFFTALGSKGLLYHAVIGKYVARALLTDDPNFLPKKLIFNLPKT